jgi:endonuclease YncB( thermonuclease family)
MLAYVYTEDGFSIDEVLVREGLAQAWTSDGQHRSLLVALESDARRDNTGRLSDDSNATG